MIAALTFVMCIAQSNGKKYRTWTLINISLWILYDVVTLSLGPLTTHIIQLVIVIAGILMNDITKKQLKS